MADFWSENLQESIQAAVQQQKTLVCFVADDSEASERWNQVVKSQNFLETLQASTVRLRLEYNTQEFGFLNAICPIQSVPALVLIHGGQIEEKLEHPLVSEDQLKEKLAARYASTASPNEESIEPVVEQASESSSSNTEQCLEFAPSVGRMRLPNNAYDSLRERTEKLQRSKISPKNILQLQLRLLDNIAALKKYVHDIRTREPGTSPALPEDAVSRLLNMPASLLQGRQPSPSPAPAVSTPPAIAQPRDITPSRETSATTSIVSSPNTSSIVPPPPPQSEPSSQSQQSQRTDYVRQQRDREAAQRAERDRIKAQIKSDREERRRLDSLRKQSELATLREQNSTTSAPKSTDIRIQVRTFDGSTLRSTFTNSATISSEVRPWIDEANPDATKVPYDFKLILTPLPNRNIEASEEDMPLPELGIVGSATFVMVPVKGFVDSYAGASSGIVGNVFGGVVSAGGSVVNWGLGMLGLGSAPAQQNQRTDATTSATAAGGDVSEDSANTSGSQVKVRTLADQRAEESKKRGNQLYNGNSLDFQGRKDDDDM